MQARLGLALFYSGDAREAEDKFRKAIETSKKPLNQIQSSIHLGEVLSSIDKLSEAEEVLQQAVESLQRFVVDDPTNAIFLVNPLIHMGYILRVTHRSVKAVPLSQGAWNLQENC